MDKYYWVASGRNGQFYVDQYRNDETGTSGTSILFPTKKLAKETAAALNTAFSRGVEFGASS